MKETDFKYFFEHFKYILLLRLLSISLAFSRHFFCGSHVPSCFGEFGFSYVSITVFSLYHSREYQEEYQEEVVHTPLGC